MAGRCEPTCRQCDPTLDDFELDVREVSVPFEAIEILVPLAQAA